MKRSVILALVTLTIAAASPSEAAAPFGSFGGKVGGGNSGSGFLPLHGWALDDGGIAAVDILVDGVIVGRATYQRARPAVTAKYPGYPDSALPGFAYMLDTTHFLNGRHSVQPQVLSKSGEIVRLQSRNFQFLNTSHNLLPFGKIEFPPPNAQLWGVCNLANPARIYSVIQGYALDAGLQQQDTGIGYVELLIDRALWANTETDCHYNAATGGLTDCYGFVRQDIEQAFPGLDDPLHSGFRFVVDIGALVGSPGSTHGGLYTRGHHKFSSRAGDNGDQDDMIAEISVTFNCIEDYPDVGSFGDIYGVVPGLPIGGTVTATGWALDVQGIATISIVVDGTYLGNAIYGLPNAIVSGLYPGYVNTVAPGWSFALDSTKLSNGVHFLNVVAYDNLGRQTLIGERPFVVANPEN
jgi:hypothetical protein